MDYPPPGDVMQLVVGCIFIYSAILLLRFRRRAGVALLVGAMLMTATTIILIMSAHELTSTDEDLPFWYAWILVAGETGFLLVAASVLVLAVYARPREVQ